MTVHTKHNNQKTKQQHQAALLTLFQLTIPDRIFNSVQLLIQKRDANSDCICQVFIWWTLRPLKETKLEAQTDKHVHVCVSVLVCIRVEFKVSIMNNEHMQMIQVMGSGHGFKEQRRMRQRELKELYRSDISPNQEINNMSESLLT